MFALLEWLITLLASFIPHTLRPQTQPSSWISHMYFQIPIGCLQLDFVVPLNHTCPKHIYYHDTASYNNHLIMLLPCLFYVSWQNCYPTNTQMKTLKLLSTFRLSLTSALFICADIDLDLAFDTPCYGRSLLWNMAILVSLHSTNWRQLFKHSSCLC